MLRESELADLGKIAVERTRKAVMSVGQLIEDDQQRAAMLTAVAADIVKGAIETITENLSEGQATGVVLLNLLHGLGIETKNTVDGAVARFVK